PLALSGRAHPRALPPSPTRRSSDLRIARFMERGLKANGFASTVVEDGISALDLAPSGDFDLLILDVGLPRMDGFQVLRALREMRSEEHTSELQSRFDLVCRLLLEKK